MPTVFRSRGFRFFFFSNEGTEPRHVHVEKGESYAKFWLDSVALADASGFRSSDLTKLRRIVTEQRDAFIRRWDEHFHSS